MSFCLKAKECLAALAECGNLGCSGSPAAPGRVNPEQLFVSIRILMDENSFLNSLH
jgi:hypothetical protein